MAFAPPAPTYANVNTEGGVGGYAGRVVSWTIVLALVYMVLKGSGLKYLSYLGIGSGAASVPLSTFGSPSTTASSASSSGGGGGQAGAQAGQAAAQAAEIAAMVLL